MLLYISYTNYLYLCLCLYLFHDISYLHSLSRQWERYSIFARWWMTPFLWPMTPFHQTRPDLASFSFAKTCQNWQPDLSVQQLHCTVPCTTKLWGVTHLTTLYELSRCTHTKFIRMSYQHTALCFQTYIHTNTYTCSYAPTCVMLYCGCNRSHNRGSGICISCKMVGEAFPYNSILLDQTRPGKFLSCTSVVDWQPQLSVQQLPKAQRRQVTHVHLTILYRHSQCTHTKAIGMSYHTILYLLYYPIATLRFSIYTYNNLYS